VKKPLGTGFLLLEGTAIKTIQVSPRKDSLLLDNIIHGVFYLLETHEALCQFLVAFTNRVKGVHEHETFIDLGPTTDFSIGSAQFQIHEHAERIGPHITDSLALMGLLMKEVIESLINSGDIGHRNEIHVEFLGAGMHAFATANFFKAGLLEHGGQLVNIGLLTGSKEIVVGNTYLWVIELMFLWQMGINGLSAITEAFGSTQKFLYNADGPKNLRIMGGLVIGLLLCLIGGGLYNFELPLELVILKSRRLYGC